MKTLKVSSVIIIVFLIAGFNSCKKDSQTIQLDCTPTSDYYFSGIVGSEQECWNENENGYVFNQNVAASYSDSTLAEITSNYWLLSLGQHANFNTISEVTLSVYVPYTISKCSHDEFNQSFHTGTYNFIKAGNLSSGIEITYTENGESYSSMYGSQKKDKYVNCTEASAELGNDFPNFNCTYSIRCNLYKSDGTFFKEIVQSQMRVNVTNYN